MWRCKVEAQRSLWEGWVEWRVWLGVTVRCHWPTRFVTSRHGRAQASGPLRLSRPFTPSDCELLSPNPFTPPSPTPPTPTHPHPVTWADTVKEERAAGLTPHTPPPRLQSGSGIHTPRTEPPPRTTLTLFCTNHFTPSLRDGAMTEPPVTFMAVRPLSCTFWVMPLS